MRYLTFALAFSSASALVVRHPYSPSARRLYARQAPVIDPDAVPDQCTQQCTPVLNDSQNCATGDNTCICQAQVASDYQTCINCIFDATQGDPTLAPVAQSAANVFNSVCSQAGITVASVTVPAFGAQPTAPSGQQQPPPPPQNTAPPPQASQPGGNAVSGTQAPVASSPVPPPEATTSVASTVDPAITQQTPPAQNSLSGAVAQTSGVPSVSPATPTGGAIRDVRISGGVVIVLVGVITQWLI